jgi:hypothetical protein
MIVGLQQRWSSVRFNFSHRMSLSCAASARHLLLSLSDIGSLNPSPVLHEAIARRVPRRTLRKGAT